MRREQPWVAPGARARRFPELETETGRLTGTTRSRLERALVHALTRRGQMLGTLSAVTAEAAVEMRGGGLSRAAVLEILGSLVEDTGRACGADRPSLLNGLKRWVPVRDTVLEAARVAMPDLDMPDGAERAHRPLLAPEL